MTPPANNPLWYKDAVVYEVPVLSFFDADGDGHGDLEGLRRKLPYLEWLGVDTIWLLPFLDSPLRDGGYDTADHHRILPVLGTRAAFDALLAAAHARGIRVVMTLVLNHTSDRHPWFQEARQPASPRHDWYVWSDDNRRYRDAPILFSDAVTSNWSFDPTAGRYYWHRFFTHQPDLNYDNPAVRRAMQEVVFYWLDSGVDGLRLEAVPFLFEREGTACTALPQTTAYLRELRQAVDARYGPGRLLWAETCEWTGRAEDYYAGGRTVQLATNVPLMSRLYLALCSRDAGRLVEALERTHTIPDAAQWALFLRNHDELPLAGLDEREQALMVEAYAEDACFRIHAGIRRRLAPLVDGDRRRLELLYALLFALPGTPVLYYGDEIGMGDEPFLGDRNSVRTAMQWSPDKNGGFSRAPHHRLFLPVIDRPPYDYRAVNVETARQRPHSFLHFVRRRLALRKRYARVFGRGTIETIPVDDPSVLVFVRSHEDTQILVAANLSPEIRSVHLPPRDALRGRVPMSLESDARLPPLGDRPYHLLLAPHGCHWFLLASPGAEGQ